MIASLAEARAAGGDHHEPGHRQGLGLRLELVGRVPARLLVVVGELHEHLAHEGRSRDETSEVLRHRDEAPAVVAQIQHELVGPGIRSWVNAVFRASTEGVTKLRKWM